MCQIRKSSTNKQCEQTPLQNILHASNALLEDPNVTAKAYKIQQMLLGIQSNGIYSSPPSEDGIKVLCLDSLSDKEILLLHSLLLNEECSSTSDMRHSLEVLIPKTTMPKSIATAVTDTQGKVCVDCNKSLLFSMQLNKRSYVSKCNACYYCRKPFCSNCQPRSISYSRLGLTEKQPFCKECNKILGNLDGEDWMHICLQYLEQGTINSTKTALGCLTMALLSSSDKTKPVLDVAKGFLHNSLPELAMPLLASVMPFLESVMKESKQICKPFIHSQTWTASVLIALAERRDAQREDRLELLQAANEACEIAERHAMSMEALKLAAVSRDAKRKLDYLLKEKPQNNDIFQKISELWSIGAYDRLLSFVMHNIINEEDAIKNKTLEAIKYMYFKMTKSINAYPDKIDHNEQAASFLLNGIIRFEEGNYQEGIAEIEKSAWAGNHDLENALADVINHYMAKFPFFSTKEFFDLSASSNIFKICSLGATDENRSRCLNLIFPEVNKAQFPMPAKWLGIELVGLNVKGHRKFENAVSSQVKEGNWSEWEAALAYIDYIAACNHRSQFPLCFMYASLWIYKYIQAKPLLPDNVKYALTKTVVICLYQANGMAILRLAPGMKLYVSRLSLSILLHTLQLTKSVAGEEAIELAALLLHNVLYNCRFCPLWEMPLVSLSEIAMLNIKVNQIHSKFLLALQHISPEQRPITEAELRYQLYENDICRVHPLQDPEAARSRAMEGLLAEKGWTWNDVSRLMTSTLSPRDTDGWLSRGHTLGGNMEYSKLHGFRFNTNPKNPSIELLVVPASSEDGRIGLFSRDDVNTVLQMNSDEFNPAFFSLDPPSKTEHYHPFQKFRYSPNSCQDTDFLHTMFETDYLMKSFSVGSEVSAKPPFKQRPCKEGLLKSLPHRLIEALKPVQDRPGGHQGNVHRFWIQADKLTHTHESHQDTTTFRLGEVKMTIRSHPLFPGSDGKLEDTKEEDDPESAEAKFAADMTSAYDEISLHFPMFARLRELAKLQSLGHFIKKILQNLKEQSKGKEHCYNAYRVFNSHVNSLKPTPKKINPDACDWVPAALYQEKTDNYYSLCYGGVVLNPDLQPGYVNPSPRSMVAVNLYTTQRTSRPHGHTARPYHTSAYHAPKSYAQSAILSVQPKAKADGASGGSAGNNNGSGRSSGTSSGSGGASGGSGGDLSAHPGAAAGGRGGGGDSNDEEDDYKEERENSYRSTTEKVQKIGSHDIEKLVRAVDVHVYYGTNPKCNSTMPDCQALIYNGVMSTNKEDGQQRLTKDYITSSSDTLPFDHYFNKQGHTIRSLKSNQEYRIPCGITRTQNKITKETCGVIYCIYCKKTGKMYVGKTGKSIDTRIRQHQRHIIRPRTQRKLVSHFNSEGISLADDFKVVILEHYPEGTPNPEVLDIEMKWIEDLGTLGHEKGLNMRWPKAKK